MKKNIIRVISILVLTVVLLSACQWIMGSDPDSSPMGIFNYFWEDFNVSYALFDIKDINWNDVYNDHVTRINSNMSDVELLDVLGDMIEVLNDSHVWIDASVQFGSLEFLRKSSKSPLLGDPDFEDFSSDSLAQHYLIDGGTYLNKDFLYGRFISHPNIGYVYIYSFAGNTPIGVNDWAKKIDGILDELRSTNAIILDIRNNGGGYLANMDYIASRFASVQMPYKQVSTKNGPGKNDFSTPMTYTISPASNAYTKPVVLLTNIETASASEWFTMALKDQPNVTHAGSKTHGALSVKMPRYLINGWDYSISIQRVTSRDGTTYEGVGISPEPDYYFPADNSLIDDITHVWRDSQILNTLDYLDGIL